MIINQEFIVWITLLMQPVNFRYQCSLGAPP